MIDHWFLRELQTLATDGDHRLHTPDAQGLRTTRCPLASG